MADGDRSGLHTGMAGLPSDAQAEIESLRAVRSPTRRVVAPALEDILYEPIPVLDHGFIRVIDYMGDDSSVVQAARVSYGRGTTKQRTDAGLIGYLMRHRHTSPFEMCEIKLHVKLPIFVARQWIRHRTANINEYSARYSIVTSSRPTRCSHCTDGQRRAISSTRRSMLETACSRAIAFPAPP